MKEVNSFQRLVEGVHARLALPKYAAYFRKTWLQVVVLIVGGFVVHLPALQGEPIWDDDYLIRTNPFVKSPLLILETFRHWLFPESYASHYRPVQNIIYMGDYFLWNNNFYGFHLSSVLFHVGSAVLLYFLLRKLLPSLLTWRGQQPDTSASRDALVPSLIAFLVALLWVVHPVHSAAVDYVSGRADSLALSFAFGGWLLLLKAREISRPFVRGAVFTLAWSSGVLSLCSRESGCILMALFLLYLFAFEKSTALRRKCIVLVACLSMFGLYAGLRHLPGGQIQTPLLSGRSAPERAVLMCRALGDYGRLMFFPANLHMERTVEDPRTVHSEKMRRDLIVLEYLSIAGALMIAMFAFGALRSDRGQRLRIFGAAWFLLAYLPISNLIELNATVAEHWLYLPSIGLLIFLAGIALAFPSSWRSASVAFASCAVIALGVRSTVRSGDWLSNEMFARHTMAAGGASIRIALLLGQTFEQRGDYAAAERIYRKALQLCPDYPIARNNLADALVHQGKEDEAKTVFVAATEAAPETRKEYPRTWITALNLARLYHTQHNNTDAITVLEAAHRNYPETWELISYESELLRETNKLDCAIALVRPFTENNWWHFGATMALGRLYTEKGDVDLAEAALRRASLLDIHDTQALNLIAMIRLNQNRLQDAFVTQRRAVSRQPDEPRQYLLLSNILDKMGRDEEARAELARATRLRDLAQTVAVN
ncbi:MAG TPA: tetratricopeptide repeat protein [Chthoniobacterales bacterium]|nr:tetratricopeptide repeat protein [Chthoniobacterales bacterium]